MSSTLEAQQLLVPEIENLATVETGNPVEFSPVQLNEFMAFYVPFLKKIYETRCDYCRACHTSDIRRIEDCLRDDCDVTT